MRQHFSSLDNELHKTGIPKRREIKKMRPKLSSLLPGPGIERWSQNRLRQSFWVAEAETRIGGRRDGWNLQHGVYSKRELYPERTPKNLHKSYIYTYTGKERLGTEIKNSTIYQSIKTMKYLAVNMPNMYNVFTLKTTKHYWDKSKNIFKKGKVYHNNRLER